MNRIKAIFFLLTFSLTIVGYNMEVHYCGDKITDVSVIGESHCSCTNEKESHCEMSCMSQEEDHEDEPNDCCKTEKISISFDGVYSPNQINPEQLILLISIFNYHFFSDNNVPKVVEDFYQTPLLYYDVNLMVQSFLI